MARSLKIALVASLGMVAVIYGALEKGRSLRSTRALRQLPSTARAVLRIDLAAFHRSDAAQTLLGAFVADERLSDVQAECGLDPLRDLSEAILWVRGTESQPLQSFGLMLTGAKVDANDIAACHARLVEARGDSVIRLEAPTGPVLASQDRGSAMAILGGRTVVTGSAQTVAEAMAVDRDLLPSLGERAAIATLWPEVSRDAAIAAALDPPDYWKAGLERASKLGEEAAALEGIEAIGLSVRPARSPETELYLELATPEHALRSAELLRSWATSPPDTVGPPWDALLRSARVRVEGRRARIGLEVSTLATPR